MTEFQPMPTQPHGFTIDGYNPVRLNEDCKWVFLTTPVTIGERRAVREEWRPDFAEADIYYRDGTSRRFLFEPWFEEHSHWSIRQNLVHWQPADTMPDWAVRRYQRCVSCVPVQACNVTEEQAAAMTCYDPASGMTAVDCFLSNLAGKWPNIDEGVDSRWGWLITWEDE